MGKLTDEELQHLYALCDALLARRTRAGFRAHSRSQEKRLMAQGLLRPGDAIPLGPEKEVPDEMGWWWNGRQSVHVTAWFHAGGELTVTFMGANRTAKLLAMNGEWARDLAGPWRRLLLEEKE